MKKNIIHQLKCFIKVFTTNFGAACLWFMAEYEGNIAKLKLVLHKNVKLNSLGICSADVIETYLHFSEMLLINIYMLRLKYLSLYLFLQEHTYVYMCRVCVSSCKLKACSLLSWSLGSSTVSY